MGLLMKVIQVQGARAIFLDYITDIGGGMARIHAQSTYKFIDFGRHNEVIFMKAVDFVSLEYNLAISPAQ